MIRVALAAVIASACYAPGYKDCEVRCPAGDCPSGYHCDQDLGLCRPDGVNGPCGSIDGDGPNSMFDRPLLVDVPPVIGWGAPQRLTLDGGYASPSLGDDGLELYYVRLGDIYKKTRTSLAAAFGNPTIDTVLSDPDFIDLGADLRADSNAMFFVRMTNMGFRIFSADRSGPGNAWSTPTLQPMLETGSPALNPTISHDGTVAVWERPNSSDPFWASVYSPQTGWSPPAAVAGITGDAHGPKLSADNHDLYFSSQVGNQHDLFVASVGTAGYDTPSPLADLNTPDDESDPWISSDGREMYFIRAIGGVADIWYSLHAK